MTDPLADAFEQLGPQTIGRSTKHPVGKCTTTAEGGEFEDVIVDEPIVDNDWSRIFKIFSKNPDEFEIVDDTVKESTWQQSKGLEDGSRDVVQLWSYSARFKRRSRDAIPAATVKAWRKALMVKDRTVPAQRLSGGTYPILIADPQLGKKGTEEAVENWKRGVLGHVAAARALGPDAVHVAFQGDETENVVNSYGNQPHTVELNRSQQLELDYDMRVWTLKQCATLGVPITASSVISNHGEWTRNGGKEPVTSANDNASTHIARQVKKLFDELEPFGGPRIAWTIGDTHPGVTLTLSGVECYFSHGYIEKGKGTSTETRTRSAIERQILGRTVELGKVGLWFMAHYHHHYSNEFEGRTLFGCPAIEAEKSSEYMLDQYGVWSPPGVLGMLVGEHAHRGWSHLNVF
jgi:hypothetical protein